MDVPLVHDLVQHFAFFAGHIGDYCRPLTHDLGNVAHAFGPDSSLSTSEKFYRGGKLLTLSGLFAFCVVTGQVEGAVGTAIGGADEMRTLALAGQREAEHAHKEKSEDDPPLRSRPKPPLFS